MANPTLPIYLKFMSEGFSETYQDVVYRSEFESGPDKTALRNPSAKNTRSVKYLMANGYLDAWRTWYKDSAKHGAVYIDIPDPLTGTTVEARIIGGTMTISPVTRKATHYYVEFEFESIL